MSVPQQTGCTQLSYYLLSGNLTWDISPVEKHQKMEWMDSISIPVMTGPKNMCKREQVWSDLLWQEEAALVHLVFEHL